MTRQFNEVCVQNMSSLEVLRLNVNNEHSMFVYSIRNQSFANMLIIFVPLVEIVLFTFFFSWRFRELAKSSLLLWDGFSVPAAFKGGICPSLFSSCRVGPPLSPDYEHTLPAVFAGLSIQPICIAMFLSHPVLHHFSPITKLD